MIINILLAVIALHLIVGFAWLFYKLSPKDGEELIDNQDKSE